MRNLLIACLFFITTYPLTASINDTSNYETIVDTTKIWVTYQRGSMDPFETGFTLAWRFSDSTKIDGKYWMNVINSWDSLYNYWEVQGYIYEADKVVTYMDKDDMIIDTLYDFNKVAGDRLDWCIGIWSIDSIDFIGKKRRAQHIQGHHLIQEYHYEGIGSNAGLMGPYNFCKVGMYTYLVCYYEKGELLYLNPEFSDCYKNSWTDNIKSNWQKQIDVYPNPTQGELQIELPDGLRNSKINIYNELGKNVFQKELKSVNNNLILNQNNGIYFYTINSNNILLKKGKIIINK